MLVDYSHFYEPAEDTYLLCDALLDESEELKTISRTSGEPLVCLEVGCGSGCVITYLGIVLRDVNPLLMATDINIEAAKATIKTSRANNVIVDVVQTTFVGGTALLDSLPPVAMASTCPSSGVGSNSRAFSHQSLDVVIFNPPYVPTPNDEIMPVTLETSETPGLNFIANAWAGGEDGRVVIDQFLPLLPELLANNATSRCYLVLVDENRPKEIARILASEYQLESKIIRSVRATNEKLHIMKITRAAPL
jgi:release factor glutamine methyltransferase